MNATSPAYSSANAPLEDLAPSDDEDITLRLSESLKTIDLNGWSTRFFGKSSGVMLVQKAMDLKKEITGSEELRFRRLEPECYPVRSNDLDRNAYILITVSSGNVRPDTSRSPNTPSLTKNWA